MYVKYGVFTRTVPNRFNACNTRKNRHCRVPTIIIVYIRRIMYSE